MSASLVNVKVIHSQKSPHEHVPRRQHPRSLENLLSYDFINMIVYVQTIPTSYVLNMADLHAQSGIQSVPMHYKASSWPQLIPCVFNIYVIMLIVCGYVVVLQVLSSFLIITQEIYSGSINPLSMLSNCYIILLYIIRVMNWHQHIHNIMLFIKLSVSDDETEYTLA